MKVIIAGCRNYDGGALGVEDAVRKAGLPFDVVISGGARGVDTAAEIWAEANGIPVERYPADWKLHGKKAGPIRNAQMAEAADALIAIWDGKSPGTRDMISRMEGKPVFIHWI